MVSGQQDSGQQTSIGQVSQSDQRTLVKALPMSGQSTSGHRLSPNHSPLRGSRSRSRSPDHNPGHQAGSGHRSNSGHQSSLGYRSNSGHTLYSTSGHDRSHRRSRSRSPYRSSRDRRSRSHTRSPCSHRDHNADNDVEVPADQNRRRLGRHLSRSPSPVYHKHSRHSHSHDRSRSRSRSRSVSSDDERDVISMVKFTDLLNQMEFYLGDDLPPSVASPLPAPCRSAIRATKDAPAAVRHLPISPLITSSFLKAQNDRLGFSTSDNSTRPPVHFKPSFPSRGKPNALPRFKKQYYKTEEDILKSVPAVLEPDASSLWGSKPPSVPSSFTVTLNEMDKTETVARRSLLALNSCEWFLASLIKSDTVPSDEDATQDEYNDALLFSKRIKESIGMCLETIASNQTCLLSSLLLQKMDSVLKGHSGAIHPGLVPFLRAQPLLSGTSIFGEVSELAKEMQEANKSDRTFLTMRDAVTAMSRAASSNKSSFSSQTGSTTRGAGQSRPNARARGAQRGGLGRSTPFTSQKQDFTTPTAQPQSQPGRGRARGRGGRGRPFPNRGATGRRPSAKLRFHSADDSFRSPHFHKSSGRQTSSKIVCKLGGHNRRRVDLIGDQERLQSRVLAPSKPRVFSADFSYPSAPGIFGRVNTRGSDVTGKTSYCRTVSAVQPGVLQPHIHSNEERFRQTPVGNKSQSVKQTISEDSFQNRDAYDYYVCTPAGRLDNLGGLDGCLPTRSHVPECLEIPEVCSRKESLRVQRSSIRTLSRPLCVFASDVDDFQDSPQASSTSLPVRGRLSVKKHYEREVVPADTGSAGVVRFARILEERQADPRGSLE
jgi:hypothetical protein